MPRSTMQCQQYHPVDISVKADCGTKNPFFADLKGIFTGPNGEMLSVPGFYDGNETWKVRFSPTQPGKWAYLLSSSDLSLNRNSGSIVCMKNTNRNIHGGLRIHPHDPHHFQFQDGANYYLLAYEADWLWALGLGDPKIKKIKEFIDIITKAGFNQVIMNVYAHDTGWCRGKTSKYDYGPPPMYAWEGTNEEPDHSRMNIEFFRNYDRMMEYMMKKGVAAHIMIKVYNKAVKWPERYSQEEDLYFRYVTARYQAFPNVIWDFSKETYNEPDKAYIMNRLDLIRTNDAYRRLVTVHDDRAIFEKKDFANTVDFITSQEHTDFHYCTRFQREALGRPYLNSEFGYEWGPKGEKDITYGVGHGPEEVLMRAYEIASAGGYLAYYYTNTAWDVIDHRHIPKGYGYFKILKDFFTSVDWWKFRPALNSRQGRMLAIPGFEYIIFVNQKWKGAQVQMDLRKPVYAVTWLNIFTGQKVRKSMKRNASGYYRFASPFEKVMPCIIHIKAK